MLSSGGVDLRARMRARMRSLVAAARRDSNAFVELTARIEGNQPIQRQHPVHREWHDFVGSRQRAVLFAPVGHGKSNQISRWRVEWEIGKNPNLRVAIISATEKLPKKFLGAIKQDIVGNAAVRAVFPELKPELGSNRLWAANAILVKRSSTMPDPTVQICGAYGNILGSRLDLIVLDDMCDLENTLTSYQRDKLYDWVSSEVLSRLPPDGKGRVWALGHVWHDQDLLSRLARIDTYEQKTYRCTHVDDEGVEVPLIDGLWTVERLHARAKELGPIFSQMMLWNRLPAKGVGRMRREWFEKCLQRGRGLPPVAFWDPMDAPTYTGVDLGFSEEGSLTVLFTAAVLPDGTRRILDVRSGRWTGPEVLEQLQEVNRRFGSIIAVEDNAAQGLLLDFGTNLTTLPLRRHTTGPTNKHNLRHGVEALGIELERGQWVIPCDEHLRPTPEIQSWINEGLAYSPEAPTGDRWMAGWICKEAIRLSPTAAGVEVVDIDTLVR